jgi:hypothetical protein
MKSIEGYSRIGMQSIYEAQTVSECLFRMISLDKIDRVIHNDPATVVFWNDGTKTVVKTSPNDTYDKEKGILWAFYLKYGGNTKNQLQKRMRELCEGGEECLK